MTIKIMLGSIEFMAIVLLTWNANASFSEECVEKLVHGAFLVVIALH